MFYSNHGHYLSLSITGSTTSELPIVAVSPCSIACSGPGAQRYCGMDERMSRKTTVSLFRVRCYGTVAYIPRRVCLKPNRSRACPSSAWPKGHTFKGVMSPVSFRYVLASDGPRCLALILFFLHFAVRSNIMDDVHTHQVTDK